MTVSNGRLSLRADLICKTIWLGSQKIWVIKDPLSRAFSYFTEQEYAMLCLADGSRTIDQLIEDCQNQIAPQTISPHAVARFYTAAHTGGIILVDGASYRHSNRPTAGRAWWRNPLAIRFPGINPDRILDRFVAILKPLISPTAMIAAVLLMIAGCGISIAYFFELAEDLNAASTKLMSGQGLIGLLVVISFTKIVHELAHAVTCKLFGGDVLELGVMLLFAAPCLYCDVSDAWLMEQRWKRVLVSAAGILAEWTIASVLAIVWVFSADGQVRDICVIVMVVCSISTVLFNGNPLLRYDGYFILSDLMGVPNLAAESAAQVRSWIHRLVWGVGLDSHPDRPIFVGLYGIASGLYRIALYSTITWIFYSIAKQYQADKIFSVVAAIAFGSVLWKWLRSIFQRPVPFDSVSPRRPIAIALCFVAIALVIGLVPLTHSVSAPMLIEPAGARHIFVTRAGRIVESLEPGSEVEAGMLIARLKNPEMELELAANGALCDRLQMQLEGLRQSRATNDVSSAEIESTERAYAAASKQLMLVERNIRDLELRSPCSGRIYAARPKNLVSTVSHLEHFWSGTPTDRANRGAWLEPGTVVCLVGDPTAREAIVLLRQQEIDLVRTNQWVSIRLAGHHRGKLFGQVIGLSSAPVESIPEELAIAEQLQISTIPHFLVRVQIDDEALQIPIRTIGHAKIYVERESILRRISRLIADSFG